MKSFEQELLEIENFYKHCTLKEALAFSKALNKRMVKEIEGVFTDIKVVFKRIKSGFKSSDKKNRSCLTPMACRTVTPARPYDMDAGKWMYYIRSERRYMDSMLRIQEEIAMEELLIQAQKILINK
ncbi:hypothetical protein [Pedobacter antarcticus]|uniref:hypothetical protein n=1 Tax=Pedobacter antarcticus TaxID=34086 RepID=UPI00292FF5F5|nr:hypothetical protein [Pedobacter antarcticus]